MEYTATARRPAARARRTSSAPAPRQLAARAREAAGFLRLLANPSRLMILCALAEGECSVGGLAERLGVAQPNVSQHLFRLRAEGLVATRREGQTIHYRLASARVAPLIGHLYDLFCRP